MATELYLCLDLGNDTLKISFAYDSIDGECYGKLMLPDLINQVAIPAAACYDQDTGKWCYAEELEQVDNSRFSTVVKIKSLLSLLNHQEDPFVEEQNQLYYREKHYFPKFSFPIRRRMRGNFQYLVDQKLVFEAAEDTPQSLCETFFHHAKKIVESCVADLARQTGTEFEPLTKIVVVYPPKQGDAYVAELARLVEAAFAVPPTKILTSTQALGLLAFHQGLLNNGERVLFFDMGDETVSVTKAWLNEIGQNVHFGAQSKVGILIDSPEGHSKPLDLGGEDVDEAIASYLEDCIHDRETVGSPSADMEGHIYENGLTSTQYLLMKDIKKAKMVMPLVGEGIFRHGVPLSIHRETLVQRMLTVEDFQQCVGITGFAGVANRTLDYIVNELRLPVNRDVTKVLFAGGMIESFGLHAFLEARLRESYPYISVVSFGGQSDEGESYQISPNEISTYASSLGGAVVAMKDYSVDAVLSYSYGTWLYHDNYKKHLKLFANRGDLLLNDENRFAMEATMDIDRNELEFLEGDELFSTVINMQELEAHAYADRVTYDGDWLIVGEDENDWDRKRARDEIDLRVVAGGKGTEIHFYYNKERVAISSSRPEVIYFEEGFVVDRKGAAQPFFSNLRAKNDVEITVRSIRTNMVSLVNARDIEFHLRMNTIMVTTNN